MAILLIVDDSHELQELYKEIFSELGYEIFQAFDGEDALNLLRTISPHVILLDMMMPRVDGLQFLTRFSKECKGALPPVIANSGFEGFKNEALKLGARVFLLKPTSMDILIKAVQSIIAGNSILESDVSQNIEQVRLTREKSKSDSAELIKKLEQSEVEYLKPSLKALTYWIQRYYGFGVSFLHFLSSHDLQLEATYGDDTEYLFPGNTYPRHSTYCNDVIDAGSTLLINNALYHPSPHFSQHHEVTGFGWHFYIGAPLITQKGTTIGTICLMDREPRFMYQEDISLFESLGLRIAEVLEKTAEQNNRVDFFIDHNAVFSTSVMDLIFCVCAKKNLRSGGELQIMLLTLKEGNISQLAKRASMSVGGLRSAVFKFSSNQVAFLQYNHDSNILKNAMKIALDCFPKSALSEVEIYSWDSASLREIKIENHGLVTDLIALTQPIQRMSY